MRKPFLFVIISMLITSVFAAPFGLKMGMTLTEIENQCEGKPVFVQDDIYLVTPIKSHPLFEEYAVFVNKTAGLYKICAISQAITVNKYGTELKNAFDNIKDRISKTYGKPRVIDEIDKKSIWKDDNDWFTALKEGARVLSAVWGENVQLADNLNSVVLNCAPDDRLIYYGKGIVILYYYFKNASIVEDEQDSVF
ncbi:MAG: hypothetical protein J5647_13895 [Spirochaetaceae bacterium]|nr:hypothetical protein [Spirochaetaceae bacterium]